MHHFPSGLSGGEQQQVALARALAKRLDLLLCDEPTGALDLATGRGVLALLRDVNRVRGVTVLVVTHNAAIARMADRVTRMRSGQVVDDARVTDPVDAGEVEW
jgi:putative ABC transport system ATP-binding protein